jgi:hypothetical protein
VRSSLRKQHNRVDSIIRIGFRSAHRLIFCQHIAPSIELPRYATKLLSKSGIIKIGISCKKSVEPIMDAVPPGFAPQKCRIPVQLSFAPQKLKNGTSTRGFAPQKDPNRTAPVGFAPQKPPISPLPSASLRKTPPFPPSVF